MLDQKASYAVTRYPEYGPESSSSDNTWVLIKTDSQAPLQTYWVGVCTV